ncbi:MAG: hypothetical protein WC348_01885 [Patescibacteria group bacterium]|jgi:hypothetical protein
MSLIQKNHKVRRWTVSTVLVFFILTQVLSGVFFYAHPAEAQLVVSDPITSTQTTIKNIKDFLKVLVVNAGTMALINAASRFMQKISYDLAVSLASGGNGQMPLFSTEGWGDYLESAALDAAGEFIGSFGDMVGVNFCAPPNPRLGLALQLQLAQTYADGLPPPTCEWSSIRSNWESFIAEVQTEDFLREAASQFQIGYGAGTDLDLAMSAYVGAFGVEKSASETAALTREEGQGFFPSSELISGKVKTPSEVIRQTSQIQTEGPVQAENLKWSLSGQALSAGAQGILSMMVSTFVSTLLSKTMENIFSKGMYSLADLFPEGDDATSAEGTAWGGRRAAELAFADLLVPQIKEGGAYDILSDFIVCPEKFKGTNNCVMDGKFEAGVRQAQTGAALTVGEAIEQEYLNGKWPLFPPSNLAKNQDPNCYTYGYCYSNLVKLRKARIISIGWEIAAQSQTSLEPVSLKEVVDRFHDCNAAGEADAEHKYCHLIDPDWILKAPAEQCRARVYGPLLQTTENSFRQETCVDSPTCIAEDDQGNCEGGWGYCTREKNIWRLDGDKCDAQYDTCKLLRKSDGQNVAYVTNTVDYGPPCNADDIGCRWYSDRQLKVGDIWQWQDTLTGSGTAARRSDRIFFNKNITQCDEPGCNEFLRTTSDTKLNLVNNSSFENVSGTPPVISGWSTTSGTASSSSDTYFGQKALNLAGTVRQVVNLDSPRGDRTFTLSLYAKNCGEEAATDYFTFGGVSVLGGNFENSTSYRRINGPIHTFPSGDASTTIEVLIRNASPECLIDAVQLEEGTFSSQYHEGWGRTGEALYLKTAPDYYSCYDYTASGALNKTNDAEQCGNFARACEEKDVGCDEYRPTNGDPSVPGVANYPDDYCPAECVGYQTFKQVETDFEQDKFPVYFIPATGRTCSAADVGCDQFTSLENEAVANFNYVRRCEKPGATSKSFYTWEGSDTTGYQLKTWNLKMSNVVSAPVSDSDPGNGVSPDGGVPPCTALMPDGLTCDGLSLVGLCTKADTLTNPDCREFYDAAGLKHYRLYSKTIVATDDCHPYRKTISSASDCGSSGGRWDTVKSECAYNVYLPESRSCGNEAVGCRAYRGNAGANTAVILNDTFDDAADGAATGWDEADIPTISSESLVVGGKSLSFGATGTIDKNLASSVRKNGFYTLSFWAKGNSRLDIKFLGATSADKGFSSATRNVTNLSFDWRYFSLGPVYVDWDVVGGGETLRIAAAGGTTPVYLDNIILREIQSYIYVVKNSWVTPTSCDRSFAVNTSITSLDFCVASGGSWSERNECVLSALLPQAQLGCASYYDRANGLHYLKSFSRLCSPDAAGCAKLLKTNNNIAASMETFNTENDSDPSLSDEERLSDNVTIPTDSFAYIVVNDAYKCAAQNKGCAEFGSPTLDAAGNVKIDDSGKPVYNTVNLLADPALYNSPTGRILCQVGFLSCEEYTTTDGGKLYFKDPGNRLCEWKDNVNLGGQNVSGWFKKQEKASDPLTPCDPANFNGGYYNIWKNGDANCSLPYVCQDKPGDGIDPEGDGDGVCRCGPVPVGGGTAGVTATGKAGTTCTVSYNKRSCPYSGWAGECIPQADQCTKFTDPGDTSDDPYGAAYYYVNNDKISSGNCNGMASQKSGCVLFNDTSNPQLNKNANATYLSSEKKVGDPGGLVAPIDCSQGGENCKRCLEKILRPPNHEYYWGDFCGADSDCAQRFPGESSTLGCQDVANYSYNSPYVILLEKDGTPITVANNSNDSNRLVQVRRDRVCGEWLTCSGTTSTFDSQTGRQKTLCDTVSSCHKYAKVGQATAQCTDSNFTSETSRQILSKKLYVSRDTTFKGMDYSGDSIYNQYQAPDLRGINIGTPENSKLALVFVEDRCFNADGTTKISCGADSLGYCDSNINGSRCGDRGKCYNHLCVTNFRGDPFVPGAILSLDPTNTETASCRAYPEQSSPFPDTVTIATRNSAGGWTVTSKKSGFAGANVCETEKICEGGGMDGRACTRNEDCSAKVCVRGTEIGNSCAGDSDCDGTAGSCAGGTCTGTNPDACECSYRKISYSGGSVVKYFSTEVGSSSALPIPDVCVGGSTPGQICNAPTDCLGTGADCVRYQREDDVIGWQGYCLERDTATSINGDPSKFACLTWYPIDQIPGAPDVYNNYPEAGFSIVNANFCLAPESYTVLRTSDGYYCASLGPSVVHLAFTAGPLGCGTDDLCDGDPGEETRNAFDCGFDGRYFCNDEGKCCDTNTDWVVLAPCESGGMCTSYMYNRAPFRCVPKNSKHADPSNPNVGQACNLEALGSLINNRQDVLPVGAPDGKIDYYILNDLSDHPGGRSINDFNDCQKDASPSRSIGANSFIGCKVAAQVSRDLSSLDSNKAWTDRVWEFSSPSRTSSVPYVFSNALYPSINYSYNTPKTPFGLANPPVDTNLRVPTCLKTDQKAINLPTDPLTEDTCLSGYEIKRETDRTIRNESRPYLWIGEPEGAAPPAAASCFTAQECNVDTTTSPPTNINCVSYQCYQFCNTANPCPSRETCTAISGSTGGYCASTAVPVTGLSSDWVNNCRTSKSPAPGIVLGDCNGGARLGLKCQSDNGCWAYTCSGALMPGECIAADLHAPPPRVTIEDAGALTKAKERLKKIFAKSYGFMVWDSNAGIQSLGAYRLPGDSDYPADQRNAINITDKIDPSIPTSDWPSVPQVWPITNCTGDKCVPLTEVASMLINGVTVGGISGFGFTGTGVTEPINVVGYGGQYVATMQFFGTADKNAGPITSVQVDWGIGPGGVRSGSRDARYKNHLGRAACNNSDFAHSADAACIEDFFSYTHTYSCPKDGEGKTPCSGAVNETNCYAAICPEDINGGLTGNGSCCVYKPKVQLTDNWGWCNGNCGSGTARGCYADFCDGGPGKDPWTYFAGRVIVVPK